MKERGSKIVVKALEEEGARFTFGIPGTHNVELYDALEDSEKIVPVLVTDEQSASFMADGVSRSTGGVGVVNVVPGAGITHCLSGVAEAFMDNIPMVVIGCGIRRDTGNAFQVHDIDQISVLKPVTKAVLSPDKPDDIYPTMRKAFDLARSGTPGPVAVVIPAEFYIVHQEFSGKFIAPEPTPVPRPSEKDLEQAAAILKAAKRPVLYLGNGAVSAHGYLQELAEKLAAPVATTIQGKGVFSEKHPLWMWNGLGAAAPPFVRTIMNSCDALLAIGCRFGEVATGSYGFKPVENMIHVDVNTEVFNRNYAAKLAIASDAEKFVEGLIPLLQERPRDARLEADIAAGHARVRNERHKHHSDGKVSPWAFFETLQDLAGRDAIYTTDSGNGTFMAMEHLRLEEPRCFLAPVDFSCMGYSVPAAIGAKFANPDRDVVALAGDGALLMTGLELLTASDYEIAPVVCVLRDGELAQIVQMQRTSLNRDTCSILPSYSVEALAGAARCKYFYVGSDDDVRRVLKDAFDTAREGKPALVRVEIDYSHKTYFTKGILTTNFWRLPWDERLRMISRLACRKVGLK